MDKNIKVFYWERKENTIFLDFWKIVQKEMETKGYKFTLYVEKKNPKWEYLIDNVETGKYDIVIAPIFYDEKRLKKVDYTYPITTYKQNILYDSKINKKNKLLFFFSKAFPCLICIVFISILFSYIIFISDKNNFNNKLYSCVAGFLGQSGGILSITNLNNKYNILISCLTLVVIYFITVILYSWVIGQSIFYRGHSPFFYNMEKKKIIVNSGYTKKINELKKLGAIPIIYNNKEKNISSIDFYIKNMDKYDGVFYIGTDLIDAKFVNNTFIFKKDGKKIELRKSQTDFESEYIGFPLNKKKKTFITDLNKIFQKNIIENIHNKCTGIKNNELLQCHLEFNPEFDINLNKYNS